MNVMKPFKGEGEILSLTTTRWTNFGVIMLDEILYDYTDM